MAIPCGRSNSPSPSAFTKFPSRSNTTTGLLPRLNTYTRSCESTATEVASPPKVIPCGTLAHIGTGSKTVDAVAVLGVEVAV